MWAMYYESLNATQDTLELKNHTKSKIHKENYCANTVRVRKFKVGR